MRFLLFQLKTVSYDSYLFFSNRLAAALEACGHETVFFRAADEPLEAMERFCGESFDAVIDFNSDLPKLLMDDDSFFLDRIDAPFFDVILDHPLYHHDMLKQHLSNFHVLCLDENHRDYILEYYPHIQNADVLPMTGGVSMPEVPFEKREIPLLFTGSYTDPDEVKAAIALIPDFMREDTNSIIELMRSDPTLPIESAAKTVLGENYEHDLFPATLKAFFLADTYLRAESRSRLLQVLTTSGLPIKICGNGYEKAPFYDACSGIFIPERTFSDSLSLMSHAKLCLNLNPLFKAGIHDRVFSAMLNGSAVLTDGSTLLNRYFDENIHLFSFQADDFDSIPSLVSKLLADGNRLAAVAAAGQKEARLHHTWEARCAQFLNILS